MLIFLLFKMDFSHWEWKGMPFGSLQEFETKPVMARSSEVQGFLGDASGQEAQAIFLGAMREIDGLVRQAFDVK